MMMKTPSNKKSGGWQAERELILHRLCERMATAQAANQPMCRLVHRMARRWSGRPFKADPARKLALSYVSLWRFYRAWKLGGRLPSALRLKFNSPPQVSALAMISLLEYCTTHRAASLRGAWAAWLATPRGRRWSGKVSYASVVRYFPVETFKALQGHQQAVSTAENALADLRLNMIGTLREQLPDQPTPRGHQRRAGHWQI